MRQIKNYLSRIQQRLHSVLLIMDEEQELTDYLHNDLEIRSAIQKTEM